MHLWVYVPLSLGSCLFRLEASWLPVAGPRNLIELRREGKLPIDDQELKSWLVQDLELETEGFPRREVLLTGLLEVTGFTRMYGDPKIGQSGKQVQSRADFAHRQEYGISSADFHAEYSDSKWMAVLAFPSHRVSRSMVNAPPPNMVVRLKPLSSQQECSASNRVLCLIRRCLTR